MAWIGFDIKILHLPIKWTWSIEYHPPDTPIANIEKFEIGISHMSTNIQSIDIESSASIPLDWYKFVYFLKII